MINLRCTCGESVSVEDEAAGLTTECPRCGSEVLVPSEAHQLLELDRKTPPPLREVTMVAEPVASTQEAKPPSDDELARTFAREIRLADMADAIAQPKVSFGRDLLRSFGVLFGGPNRHMVLTMAVVDFFMLFGASLMPGGSIFFIAGVFFALGPIAWHCAIFFRACQAACAGDDDVRLVGFQEGVWDDLAKPLLRFLATWWLAMMPLWVYWIYLGFNPGPRPPVAVDMLLLGAGLFLWPATVLVVVLGDSVTALTPGNLFRMITGALGAYLLTWAALACVVALGIAGGWLVCQAMKESAIAPLLGLYLLILAGGMTGLVMMRIIGLMYCHFKADLPFAAE